MNPKTLDHVAYWLADRDSVADFVVRHLGMHVIDRTDAFTLVGADARRGKLTLFAADPPRQRGALEHVALRVHDLERALGELPDGLDVERRRDGEAYFELGDGVALGLVEADTDLDYDLDHVALRSADPQATASEYGSLGFRAAPPGRSNCPRVEVGGAWIEFQPGEPGAPEQPLLNHLAVLVDSADEHVAAARDLGVEIDDIVDAANTLAVFVWGPERVRIEYVEHKPTFSLTCPGRVHLGHGRNQVPDMAVSVTLACADRDAFATPARPGELRPEPHAAEKSAASGANRLSRSGCSLAMSPPDTAGTRFRTWP